MKARDRIAETIAETESLQVSTCAMLLTLIDLECGQRRVGWGIPAASVIQATTPDTPRPSLALLELLVHNLISSQYVGEDLRVAVTPHGYEVVRSATNRLTLQDEAGRSR